MTGPDPTGAPGDDASPESGGSGAPQRVAGEGGTRTPESPEDGPGAAVACDLCGGPMLERHCKLVCRRCGYQRDCSDP